LWLSGGRRPVGCPALVVNFLDRGSAVYTSGPDARISAGLCSALIWTAWQRCSIAQRVVVDLPAPGSLQLFSLEPAKLHQVGQIASDRLLIGAQQSSQFCGGLPDPFHALVDDTTA